MRSEPRRCPKLHWTAAPGCVNNSPARDVGKPGEVISTVSALYGKVPEFQIEPDPAKLLQAQVTVPGILDAVTKFNLIDSPGLLENNHELSLMLVTGQTQDPAGAIQWFLRTVQLGSPYLNPVGYVVCCAAGQSRQLSDTLRALRDFGIHADEIQQVVQELRNRGGDWLRPEMVQHLQTIEQINGGI